MQLSQADLTRVKQLTDRAYHLFPPEIRVVFNEQLLDSRSYYEFDDWCERVELTAKWYENPTGRPRYARRRKRVADVPVKELS